MESKQTIYLLKKSRFASIASNKKKGKKGEKEGAELHTNCIIIAEVIDWGGVKYGTGKKDTTS